MIKIIAILSFTVAALTFAPRANALRALTCYPPDSPLAAAEAKVPGVTFWTYNAQLPEDPGSRVTKPEPGGKY